MGAYGSPELRPPDQNSTSYDYSGQHYYPEYKPKGHNFGAIVFGAFLGLLLSVVLIGLIANSTKTVKTSAPVSMGEAVPESSPAPVVIDDSEDYLQSWAKAVVLKGLLYPDSAEFSPFPEDWKVVRDGNECTITSIVTAKGKKKEIGTTSFVVKFCYDELDGHATYLKIGDHISYDAFSSSE